MRAYFIRAGDGRSILETRDVPPPEPGPGQMLVRVHAAGLNRGELISAPKAPRAAGMDAAGEVAQLGAGVTQFKPGDRVMGRCPGAFAEFALMDARETLQRSATVRGFAASLLPMLADGRIKPLLDRVYAFDELPAATARMEANAHVGKIVVSVTS